MKRIAFLGLLLVLAFSACRKDEVTSTTTTTTTSPSEFLRTTIGGQIIDEAGQPVENANVFVGTQQTTTDENGVFLIKNEIVPANGAYVRVQKNGYFHGSRTITASAGRRNTVKIQLLANTSTRFIDSGTGGTADYTDYSITLPAGGIAVGTATGSSFTGEVGVAAKWLDPTSATFVEQAPGRLIGRSLDGSETGMVSMGMLAVELKAATGAKLQIKEGFQADIRMKVPAAFASKAPQTIPLWYFDEAAGIWVEEGAAELVNGFYEGKVGHFSFWNTDYKDPVVNVKFKVTDTAGNLVEGALVDTRLVSDGTYGRGHTNDEGYIWGIVPEGQVLDAKVYLPSQGCNDPVLSQQIGPFSEGDSICFTVSFASVDEYIVSGSLKDCNGAAVTEGYVKINPGANIVWADANGDFSTTIISCTPITSFDVIGYDLVAFKESAVQTVTITGNTANVGMIAVCDQVIQDFFIWEYNGATNAALSFEALEIDSFGMNTVLVSVQDSANYLSLSLLDVTGTGIVQSDYFYVDGSTNYLTCSGTGVGTNTCNQLITTIIEYNGVGGYIAGNFSGTVYTPNNMNGFDPVQISGSFRMILK